MGREINCQVCNSSFIGETSAKFCPTCRVKREQVQKRIRDARYKDRIRHGKKREQLIKENGLTCSDCGRKGNRFEIVTHHISHDSENHTEQENLCRSCHATEHYDESNFGEQKQAWNLNVRNITKDMLEKALHDTKGLEEACGVLGVSRGSLYKLRKKFGLQMTRPQKVNLSKEDLLSVKHLTQNEQAKTLGVSRRTICRFRKELKQVPIDF